MAGTKGQIAIEYLTTYGWALILLLAVVAFLFASGIFNPSRFMNAECNFQPDLPCSGFILNQQGTTTTSRLIFNVTNSLGFPIRITYMIAYSDYLGQGSSITTTPDPATAVLKQGDSALVSIYFTNGKPPTRGSMMKMNVSLFYRNCATTNNPTNPTTCLTGSPHTVSGRIVTQME